MQAHILWGELSANQRPTAPSLLNVIKKVSEVLKRA